jgi:hypothetical protein
MSQQLHICTPTGPREPAPRFMPGSDRWVAKRALSGRRTD